MDLYRLLDCEYGEDGRERLQELLRAGTNPSAPLAPSGETPLMVATRRRRLDALTVLLDHGADLDAKSPGGKTAYVHALRRGFDELCELFRQRGCQTALQPSDRFAVALVSGDMEEARRIVERHPGVVRTGNPEDDRLLADLAGRFQVEPVQFLIDAGADLEATGLDSGTPLHQAAWFGQPENARRLVDAGADLDVFDMTHESSPLGWAVHGSRYSGGAEERQDEYCAIVELLVRAGSTQCYPGREDAAYRERLANDATPRVRQILFDSGQG